MMNTQNRVTKDAARLPETPKSICLLCAEQNITCCRTEPYLAPLCFPLSIPEWRRLVPFAHLAVSAVPSDGSDYDRQEALADEAARQLRESDRFAREPDAMPDPALESALPAAPPDQGDSICMSEINVPEFIGSMHELFPGEKKRVNALFPAKGRHFTLRIRSDGSCIFLGQDGCRLPRPARPWYCRIFPAWVVGQSLTLFLLQDCLISHRAKGPAEGVRMLGTTPARVRGLYARLREDWGM